MCECNVKILYVVGVAGVSGRNARAAAKAWRLRRWSEGRRNWSTTWRVSRALFAPGNWTPGTSFISWRIGNSSASPITSRPRRKVRYNLYVTLWSFFFFLANLNLLLLRRNFILFQQSTAVFITNLILSKIFAVNLKIISHILQYMKLMKIIYLGWDVEHYLNTM